MRRLAFAAIWVSWVTAITVLSRSRTSAMDRILGLPDDSLAIVEPGFTPTVMTAR